MDRVVPGEGCGKSGGTPPSIGLVELMNLCDKYLLLGPAPSLMINTLAFPAETVLGHYASRPLAAPLASASMLLLFVSHQAVWQQRGLNKLWPTLPVDIARDSGFAVCPCCLTAWPHNLARLLSYAFLTCCLALCSTCVGCIAGRPAAL